MLIIGILAQSRQTDELGELVHVVHKDDGRCLFRRSGEGLPNGSDKFAARFCLAAGESFPPAGIHVQPKFSSISALLMCWITCYCISGQLTLYYPWKNGQYYKIDVVKTDTIAYNIIE